MDHTKHYTIIISFLVLLACSSEDATDQTASLDSVSQIESVDSKGQHQQTESDSPTSEQQETTVYIPEEHKDELSNIDIYEGASIANDTTAAYLNLPLGTEVIEASKAMQFESNMDIPYDIIVSIEGSLKLSKIEDRKDEELAIFYLARKFDGRLYTGVMPFHEFILKSYFAYFKLAGFGTYQAAYVSPRVTERFEKPYLLPIKVESQVENDIIGLSLAQESFYSGDSIGLVGRSDPTMSESAKFLKVSLNKNSEINEGRGNCQFTEKIEAHTFIKSKNLLLLTSGKRIHICESRNDGFYKLDTSSDHFDISVFKADSIVVRMGMTENGTLFLLTEDNRMLFVAFSDKTTIVFKKAGEFRRSIDQILIIKDALFVIGEGEIVIHDFSDLSNPEVLKTMQTVGEFKLSIGHESALYLFFEVFGKSIVYRLDALPGDFEFEFYPVLYIDKKIVQASFRNNKDLDFLTVLTEERTIEVYSFAALKILTWQLSIELQRDYIDLFNMKSSVCLLGSQTLDCYQFSNTSEQNAIQ